jgi:hypothetical protein
MGSSFRQCREELRKHDGKDGPSESTIRGMYSVSLKYLRKAVLLKFMESCKISMQNKFDQ